MPDKPLLMFPTPSTIGRYKIGGGQSKEFAKPDKEVQLRRLQPILDNLLSSFEEMRIELQSDISGVEPEMVLVLETRGSVQDFFKAVKNIPDLEWFGDWEKDFDPDDFFYYQDSNNQIRGKLYFVLTNFQSLRRLLTLWRNYRYNDQFDRGTTKWRDLFSLLHDIRPWGLFDRILETGILTDWNYRLQNEQEIIPFEIELWFRKTQAERLAVRKRVASLLEEFDGEIVSESIIEGIAYHGMLVKAPIQIFNNLTEQTDIGFFKSHDIMFFRPVGQCAFRIPENPETDTIEQENAEPNLTDPVVALFDGMPLQNHRLLEKHLLIDDPDNFSANYLASARIHGTSMASIIINGDLERPQESIKSRLYVRPFTKAIRTHRGFEEYIPEEILVVDLIHRAVRRIFESEGDRPPIAPTVKIINISLGDPFRVLDYTMSSWAKMIDWLAFKYNVLFLVSAGNCADDLELSSYEGTMQSLLSNNASLQNEVLKAIFKNNRHRKIISPGESINSLTVGASDHDSLTFQAPNGRMVLFNSQYTLSAISRMGLGYRRSIKPELLAPGGRALYRERIGEKKLGWIDVASQPGIKVASPSPNGSVNGCRYSIGTSNSTALMTNTAAKLYESFLESNFQAPIITNLFPLIAKCLLVHSASWQATAVQQITDAISSTGNPKDLVARFLGYGTSFPERIFDCTDKRVTIIGHGELSKDHAHLFNLPIPHALSGSTAWRSLTVTLAWFSPINSLNQIYRQAKLWFDFPDNQLNHLLSISRKFYDNDTVNRGTIQHEIFEGTRASAFLENANLGIRVNCKEDSPILGTTQIKYVLAVTFEISPDLQLNIYEQTRLNIRPRVQAAS